MSEPTREQLATQVRYLEAEVTDLRRRLDDAPGQNRGLEGRLADAERSLAAVSSQNERLAQTLREARDQIMTLKEEVDRLAQPPSGFGVFLDPHDDGTVDIFTGGRKLRVSVSPAVDLDELRRGQEVMLNEAINVVEALDFERVGEVVMLKEILEDGERALVIGHADEERVVRLAESLRARTSPSAPATRCCSTRVRATSTSASRSPRSRSSSSRRSPTSTTRRSVASPTQIDAIRDAVELPYLHPDLFGEHELRPPKGILLYGPPGCGKTLIAKAVANSLAKKVAELTGTPEGKSYFLNIKGPELLNKYVGETERHIRLVFQRAREKASRGHPGHRVLRRDGLAVPHPRLGRLLRRREHDRPAAAQRDRRRRGAGERPRDRRLQPRGHDRPGHPASRPARREDQDRAPGRRGGARHLLEVPHRHPAAARRRPRRVRRTAARPSTR